ncbi:MAG: hypothetical protein KDC07_03830 [Chitinophagaceae bacterium]|nr:hypothetical protein [Chitinophagaceae bacterium]MCB9047012.1 hypothetical protein [Chitinophagales bacterium]
MYFAEATAIVNKLQNYRGKVMKPFHAPVRNFLIVPSAQEEFDQMFKNMQDNGTSFSDAIMPYKDNVTILACFDVSSVDGANNYCYYDYFVFNNNISI